MVLAREILLLLKIMQLCFIIKMKIKNTNKNNELIAVVEVLKEKDIITDIEIKQKKNKLRNAKIKK